MFKIIVSAAVVCVSSTAGRALAEVPTAAAAPIAAESNASTASTSCGAKKTCADCTGECAWFKGKAGARNDRCEQEGFDSMGMFDKIAPMQCGECDASSCTACNGLPAACNWYSNKATSQKSCAKDWPTGGDTIWDVKDQATCDAEANDEAAKAACRALKVCDACLADNTCGWYIGEVGGTQACSLDGGSDFTGGETFNEKQDTCGTCAASACTECNAIDGCDWYELKLTGGNEKCLDSTPFTHKKVDVCKTENGASGMQISLAAVVVTGVATLLA